MIYNTYSRLEMFKLVSIYLQCSKFSNHWKEKGKPDKEVENLGENELLLVQLYQIK